jgi:membrane protein required for colicin V production
MQTYDLLMLAVLGATTLFGFWKGMAWQIASLASLVLSYFAALRFSEQLAPHIPYVGDQAPLNRFAAMLVIYVVTSFIIWTLFRLVSGVIDKVRLESFDRQLGAMFGFAKGVLLCVVITFFAVGLSETARDSILSTQSGRYIVALVDKSHSVFPPEVHQLVDPYLNRIEQRFNPNFQPHGQDLQQLWQSQMPPQLPGAGDGMQIPWPQPPQQQPAWPTETQQPNSAQRNPYAVPREPNRFPGPYSAEVPASRDY